MLQQGPESIRSLFGVVLPRGEAFSCLGWFTALLRVSGGPALLLSPAGLSCPGGGLPEPLLVHSWGSRAPDPVSPLLTASL